MNRPIHDIDDAVQLVLDLNYLLSDLGQLLFSLRLSFGEPDHRLVEAADVASQ